MWPEPKTEISGSCNPRQPWELLDQQGESELCAQFQADQEAEGKWVLCERKGSRLQGEERAGVPCDHRSLMMMLMLMVVMMVMTVGDEEDGDNRGDEADDHCSQLLNAHCVLTVVYDLSEFSQQSYWVDAISLQARKQAREVLERTQQYEWQSSGLSLHLAGFKVSSLKHLGVSTLYQAFLLPPALSHRFCYPPPSFVEEGVETSSQLSHSPKVAQLP